MVGPDENPKFAPRSFAHRTWRKPAGLFAAFLAVSLLSEALNPTIPFALASIPDSSRRPDALDAPVSETPSAEPLPAESVLLDPYDRVDDGFAVPEPMMKRVRFWFNVYTKWDSQKHVIHHARFPWVVFKIIDTAPIMNSEQGHYWTRYHRARKHVLIEKHAVEATLRKLSRKKNYSNLEGYEKEVFDALAEIEGPRAKVIRFALQNLRSQLGQQDFFLSGLRNSSKYMSYMEEEFRRFGLPTELTRLPFVESSFNERAESKVGASGIWQIMPRTGKAYMKVEKYIDERNSPLKATRAAAQLLRTYYKVFQAWPLAVTAYNHGIGSLQKAIRVTKSRDLPHIIDVYHRGSFKFASANFFACFLAAMHAEKYSEELFKHLNLQRKELLVREVLPLDRKMKAKEILQLSGLDTETFMDYNLDLKDAVRFNTMVPRGFELHLPVGKRDEFFEKLAERARSRKQVYQPPTRRDRI